MFGYHPYLGHGFIGAIEAPIRTRAQSISLVTNHLSAIHIRLQGTILPKTTLLTFLNTLEDDKTELSGYSATQEIKDLSRHIQAMIFQIESLLALLKKTDKTHTPSFFAILFWRNPLTLPLEINFNRVSFGNKDTLFPNEITEHILFYLNFNDLLSMRCVSKLLEYIVNDSLLTEDRIALKTHQTLVNLSKYEKVGKVRVGDFAIALKTSLQQNRFLFFGNKLKDFPVLLEQKMQERRFSK